jgi:hypothetical protein
MPSIREIELALLHSRSAKNEFAKSVDILLGLLFSEVPDVLNRVTDGVLFESFEVATNEIAASGIAILIDGQKVQPLRIELQFDADQSQIIAGTLHFGDAGRPPAPYGSSAHGKLARQIIASPRRDFSWEHFWRRTAHGWERSSGRK